LVEVKLKGEMMEDHPTEFAHAGINDAPGAELPMESKPSRGDAAPLCLLIRAGQGSAQSGFDEIAGKSELAAQDNRPVRDPIGELISTVERAEQRLAQRDSCARPRRFPWAADEEVEALENEMAALYERYR
jgi:hypothetical protein